MGTMGTRIMCENTTRDGICMFDWSLNLEALLYSERGATGTDWPGPLCDEHTCILYILLRRSERQDRFLQVQRMIPLVLGDGNVERRTSTS